jgi:hypothetical protein
MQLLDSITHVCLDCTMISFTSALIGIFSLFVKGAIGEIFYPKRNK